MGERTEKQITKERQLWYSKKYVKHQIVSQLQRKSLDVIDKTKGSKFRVRFLPCKNISMLDYFMHKCNFERNDNVNYYFSLAYVDYIPKFTLNLVTRTDQEDYKEFYQRWKVGNEVKGFDLAFDFDEKIKIHPDGTKEVIVPFNKVYEDVDYFKDYLDENKIPYILSFSGSKGFHIRITQDYLPPYTKDSVIEFRNLINNYGKSLPSLDINTTDLFRIWKIPYSYDNGNISLPLSDTQFNNFKIEDMTVKNVLLKNKIFNRGLLMRTHGLSNEKLIKNTFLFIQEGKQ